MTDQLRFPAARLETLIDGIFAIAMTLLVFNIKLPGDIRSNDTAPALLALWPNFWTFAQSFLLLGAIWSTHHRTARSIKEVNPGHVWMNIVWLMFVVLVPFSTSLLATSLGILGAIFFDLNLFTVGILGLLIRRHAISHRLIDDDQAGMAEEAMRRGLILPGAALIAVGFAFLSPTWSNLSYLLIPITVIFLRHRGLIS
jgi:uncharacterized membrane protein